MRENLDSQYLKKCHCFLAMHSLRAYTSGVTASTDKWKASEYAIQECLDQFSDVQLGGNETRSVLGFYYTSQWIAGLLKQKWRNDGMNMINNTIFRLIYFISDDFIGISPFAKRS